MKRARILILVAVSFLLLGVAINVGVAWLAAIFEPLPAGSARSGEDQIVTPEYWPPWIMEAGMLREGMGWRHYDTGEALFLTEAPRPAYAYLYRVSAVRQSAGFPAPAFSMTTWVERIELLEPGPVRSPVETKQATGWRSGLQLGNVRLPVAPIFSGFALNTLIYAALVACAWSGSRFLRRKRRRLKSLCSSCAYPRSGLPESAVCPECGASPEL